MREIRRLLTIRRDERAMIERIYSALATLDMDAQSTRELIAGVHALRFQVRGAYYALYGQQPREMRESAGGDDER